MRFVGEVERRADPKPEGSEVGIGPLRRERPIRAVEKQANHVGVRARDGHAQAGREAALDPFGSVFGEEDGDAALLVSRRLRVWSARGPT